ncbi:MAG: nucleotidyltransferase domain-containing protein [Acidobacteriota bacterium]
MKRRLYATDPETREQVIKIIAKILGEDPEIAFALLYGSFEGSLPFHDVDLAVSLRAVDLKSAARKAEALADQLSIRTKLPVDVRVLNAAPLSFRYQALLGRLIVCRDEELLGTLMERTAAAYLDIAPLLVRSTREAFSR